MSNNDKKILAVSCGAFLIVLVMVLFATMQAKDNMISNIARVRGIETRVGDTVVCGNWYNKGFIYTSNQAYGSNNNGPEDAVTNNTTVQYYQYIDTLTSDYACNSASGGEISSAPCYEYKLWERSCSEYKCYCADNLGTNCSWQTSPSLTYSFETDKTEEECQNSSKKCYCADNLGTNCSWQTSPNVTYSFETDKTEEECQNSSKKCYCADNLGTNCSWQTFPNATYSFETDKTEEECQSSTPTSSPTATPTVGVAKLTCKGSLSYTGSSQELAECDNCIFVTNSEATGKGTYDVVATPKSGYAFADGQPTNTCRTTIGSTATAQCCYKDGDTYKYGVTAEFNCINTTDDSDMCLARNPNPNGNAVLTCKTNLTYNGQNQELAICNNCEIISGDTGKNIGTYTVVARPNSGYNFADGQSVNSCEAVISGTCGISITNESGFKHMSIGETEVVSFNLSTGCSNKITVIKNYFTGSSEVNPGTSSYVANNECVTGTIKGCIKGTSTCSEPISIELRPQWSSQVVNRVRNKGNCSTSPIAANVAGVDCYYDNCSSNGDGTEKCTYHYRGCGSNPIPEEPEEKTYCWKKTGTNGNEYTQSTTSPGTGWTSIGEVGTVTCSEDSACYQKTDGSYITGKYNGVTGYTPVDSSYCNQVPTPVETNYCWKKLGTNGYVYIESTSDLTSSGYTRVGEVGTVTCSEDEACYQKSDGTYVIGKYNGANGYTQVANSKCTEVPVIKNYCWKKLGTNGYYYIESTNDLTSSGYTKVGEVGKVTCSEGPACYKKISDNTYVIGRYSGASGYAYYGTTCPVAACYYNSVTSKYHWTDTPTDTDRLISSIDNESDCVTPPSPTDPNPPAVEYYCFVNNTTNDYKWRTTSPGAGYVKVESINNASACTPPEEPACYIGIAQDNIDVYAWGIYKSYPSKYRYISNKHSDCEEACYREISTNNLTWGKHAGDSKYKLESNITKNSCKNVIDNVPKTSSNINTIIYVAMIIFVLTGVSFIAYTNYNKKHV